MTDFKEGDLAKIVFKPYVIYYRIIKINRFTYTVRVLDIIRNGKLLKSKVADSPEQCFKNYGIDFDKITNYDQKIIRNLWKKSS